MTKRPDVRSADGVRRVTTGIDADGRSVIVADERLTGDDRALPLWAADRAPRRGAGLQPPACGWWPPPGGVRVLLSTQAPGISPPDKRGAWPDIDDSRGFHASASSDIVIMLAGRIWCALDDGTEIELAAGDVLIQNGTRHRWRNHSDEGSTMAVIIVGAEDEARS